MSATTQANAIYHRHQYGQALLRRDGAAVSFHRDAWKYWASFK
ncbi:hypothetical protein ACEN2T_17785 [Pseudomonas sp. W22_MBD1_FP4]